jgi:hypothetical protein
MDKFVVPQFIDVEDKIIGPITVRQFILGTISGFFLFLSYKLFDLALFVILAILIMGLYILLGFIKINGQHFHLFLASVLGSLFSPQLRVWNKIDYLPSFKRTSTTEKGEEDKAVVKIKPMSDSSELSSLSLLIDTGGKYRPEEVLRKPVGTAGN